MLRKNLHGRPGVHVPGTLRRVYRWLWGTEQTLIRPAEELPLVLISYARGDREWAERFRMALRETWPTLPEPFRKRYESVLEKTPPLVVIELRRKNICSCLGHHHPPGTESRLTRQLRSLSGVRTGELDLAVEAIRDWEPLPLSHLALPPEAETEEMASFQWQLALLAVFLHELHHLVSPQELEPVVRNRSQTFYVDTLSHFVATRFGVEYGLRHSGEDRISSG